MGELTQFSTRGFILRSFIPTGLSKAVVRVPSAPGATHFQVQDSSYSYSNQRNLLFSKCIAPLIGFNSPWIEIHGYTGSNRMNSVGCCFWCIAIREGPRNIHPGIRHDTQRIQKCVALLPGIRRISLTCFFHLFANP